MTTLSKTANKLTRKQQAFVKHLVENPKASATEAARQAYNTTTSSSAEAIAYENLRKPQIVTELAKYNNLVENTLVNTINDFKDSDKVSERALATDTAKWVHDKIHGKATQRIEAQSTSVNIVIDLGANTSQQVLESPEIQSK